MKFEKLCANVFGPCISGPNMMLTMGTSQYCIQMLLAGIGTNGGPTLSIIATAKSAKKDSLVIRQLLPYR